MYAVIKTGGKQYRVKQGDTLRVEKLAGESGDTIEFAEVLMIGGTEEAPKLGFPMIEGAKVLGELVEQGRGRKVYSFRKKKEGWKRIRGHRQQYTAVKITQISA